MMPHRAVFWPCIVLALLLAGCADRSVRPAFPVLAHETTLTHALRNHYRQWQGVPYRYGGHDESGIDCSSFVRQTFRAIGAPELPRTTSAQARRGDPIDRNELAPGDLVFFDTGGYDHVGIYVGNGRFMHASTSRGVTLSSLDNVYWHRHYWQARRITARVH